MFTYMLVNSNIFFYNFHNYSYIIIIIFFNIVCKSCLVKNLEENNSCPTCQIVIHQSHPLQYISFDRTMQDIVFKLVPGLQLGMQEIEVLWIMK